MERRIIIHRDLLVPMIEDESGQFCPLPPRGMQLKGKFHFRLHLRSTRGGGAEWSLSLPSDGFMSLGRFNPVVEGFVENPSITWLSHEQVRMGLAPFEPDDLGFIRQEFKPGFCPWAGFWQIEAPLENFSPTAEKKFLVEWELPRIPAFDPIIQGHLTLYPLVGIEFPDQEQWVRVPSRQWLFNHCLLGGVWVAKSRVGDFGRWLVRLHRGDRWVVSRNHQAEFIPLIWDWAVATHPIPREDVD